MALLSQRSVDKHIFEGSPKHRNNSKHFDLSFTGSYRKIWSHTDIKLHTDTDNSQYSRSTVERDPPPTLRRRARDLPPLSAAVHTSSERTCKTSSKQQQFTSLSLHLPPEVRMKTGPHRLCIYIRYKTRCSNVYIHNTNESIQLLIRLYIQSSKINMW